MSEPITRELREAVERDISGVACECGGYAERDYEVTEEEDRKYGCGRHLCCSRAFVCQLCKTRWIGSAAAPEME